MKEQQSSLKVQQMQNRSGCSFLPTARVVSSSSLTHADLSWSAKFQNRNLASCSTCLSANPTTKIITALPRTLHKFHHHRLSLLTPNRRNSQWHGIQQRNNRLEHSPQRLVQAGLLFAIVHWQHSLDSCVRRKLGIVNFARNLLLIFCSLFSSKKKNKTKQKLLLLE